MFSKAPYFRGVKAPMLLVITSRSRVGQGHALTPHRDGDVRECLFAQMALYARGPVLPVIAKGKALKQSPKIPANELPGYG